MMKLNKALGGGSYKRKGLKLKSNQAHRLTIKHHSTIYRPVVSVGVFLFAFLSTAIISSSLTPVSNSNAEDIGAVINSSGYFINLTSKNSGIAAIDLIATAAGTVGITEDTINIKSNAPDGYDLYLSMDNNDTDGNRLYKDANNTSSSYLTPTSGTFSSPSPLDTNSWGYALANTTTGLPTAGSSFDATYNLNSPNTDSKWAGMPLSGNEQLIQSITTPNSTEGIDTNIYYGVKANTSLPSGSYKGTVTYTAVAKANITASDQISVSPSVTTKLEGGEILTIATMLNVDANDAEDPGDPANNIPEKKVSVTIGGQACTNITLSNAQDGTLQISCTAPSMATGRYDVGVDIPKYDKFWVIVNGIQYKYSTQELDQVIGGNATAADILLGKTAYVGGTEITGTMPSYTVQYDATKTEQENTDDAGLTWSSDGSTLTIAEGYHTEQQVNSQSGGSIGNKIVAVLINSATMGVSNTGRYAITDLNCKWSNSAAPALGNIMSSYGNVYAASNSLTLTVDVAGEYATSARAIGQSDFVLSEFSYYTIGETVSISAGDGGTAAIFVR